MPSVPTLDHPATQQRPLVPLDAHDEGRPSDKPSRFFSRLSFLWSSVLFPAQAQCAESWRWRPFLLAMTAGAALLFPCLSFYLFEPDEGRYAQIPREMLERGEWLVPTLQGEPYLDKPPLFYWLVMASYALFGYHDWAARLVPALAVQAGILITFLFGRRMFGNRAAFWGALVLALFPGFVGMGRLLVLDGVFTFWVTLSLYSSLAAVSSPRLNWRLWLTAAGACALGVLTKGPVAAVLLVPPLWLHMRLSGSATRIGWRGWSAFAGIVLSVNLPWYAAVCLRMPEFAGHFFWQHNILRFAQPFDHLQPFWFFIPVLLIGLLPASLLLVPFARFLFLPPARGQRSATLGFLMLSALWCVFFFSLSGSKLPTYIMPAFPPLALAFGVYLAQSRWDRSRWALLCYLFWLALGIVGHSAVVPHVAKVRSPMNHPERIASFCADPCVPVFCFPRHVDSVAFYLGRSDFRDYRSKNLAQLVAALEKHPRAVVLCGHRNSLGTLQHHLPRHLRITRSDSMGITNICLVERRY